LICCVGRGRYLARSAVVIMLVGESEQNRSATSCVDVVDECFDETADRQTAISHTDNECAAAAVGRSAVRFPVQSAGAAAVVPLP